MNAAQCFLSADSVLDALRGAGLKLTPQRIAIVRELATDATHPTAQDLFERLRLAFPTMSFATVYNTLDALTELGLVKSLKLGGAVRFDPNTSAHHHAVCDACGAVLDLPVSAPSTSETKRIEQTFAFQIRAEERTYRGLCGRCSS